MLDIATLFPTCSPEETVAFEAAPRSLLAVNTAIDYKEALGLTDPRYVPTSSARAERFERTFFGTFGYKPGDGSFVAPTGARHVLFFGHVGCGKSTELTRMCARLHDPARYWVVRVDLLDLIDPNHVGYSDVWLAVAQQLMKKLQEDAVQLSRVTLDRLERWFSERVLTHEQVRDFAAEVKTEAEAGAGIPLLGKLLARFTSAIKTGSTHRDALRTVVRNTYGEFAEAMNALILDATEAVRRAGKGQQILFAVDGTDRFRREDWRQLFVDDANQMVLVRCIAVYTVPMALKSSGERLDLFDTLVLPMVKLVDFEAPGLPRRPEAYRAMRAIVLKRCHHSLIDTQETLDALITYSGGHLRDALRLLAYACVDADGSTLDRAAVEAAAKRLAGDYRAWLHASHYTELARAARDPENAGTSDVITRLVDGGALLEYNNGSWRQPHPVIRLLPAFQRAERAAEGG